MTVAGEEQILEQVTTVEPTGSSPSAEGTERRRVFRLADRHLGRGSTIAQRWAGRGAVEVAASGHEVRLSDGRVLLDFGTQSCTLVGHRHPLVLDAVQRQLDRMPGTTRLLLNEAAPRLASGLVQMVQPSRLQMAWFGQNGCDAVEAALKMARWTTGRPRVLAVEGAFHGKSLGALAATWSPRHRQGLEHLLPGVTHLAVAEDAAGAELERGDVAAIIVEPIQGENGVRRIPLEVLRAWRDAAREAGAMFVADEIQTGLRRCGAPSVAVGDGLDPDAVLFGKALGGGVVPISAVLGTAAVFAPLTADPLLHTSTFSEHPLSCAAGVGTLAALGASAPRYGHASSLLEELLGPLTAEPGVVSVRCEGLLGGIELCDEGVAARVLYGCAHEGVLLSPCVTDPRVVRALGGLVAEDRQLRRAVDVIRAVCRDVALRGEDAGGR